jgi:hypothetical protein
VKPLSTVLEVTVKKKRHGKNEHTKMTTKNETYCRCSDIGTANLFLAFFAIRQE